MVCKVGDDERKVDNSKKNCIFANKKISKMKHNRSLFILTLMGITIMLGLQGCEKELTLRLKVTIAQYVSKEKVGLVGYVPYWLDGDCVMVNGENSIVKNDGHAAYTEVPIGDSYYGIYPAEYVADAQMDNVYLDIPKVQEYVLNPDRMQKVLAPMGGYSDGKKEMKFTPMGALLKIEITNLTERNGLVIDKVSLCASSVAMWGLARVSNITTQKRVYKIEEAYEKGVNDSILLSSAKEQGMGVRIDQNCTRELYLYLPAIEEADNRFGLRVFAHNSKNDFVYEIPCLPNCMGKIPQGSMIEESIGLCDSNEHLAISGALGGVFTINGRGKRVVFAKGNLQYQGFMGVSHATAEGEAFGVWRFADRQYDYIGEDNAMIDASYTGWIDLLGWGTSGYHDADDEYNSNYQPYSSSSFYDYSQIYNYYGYGPSTHMPDPSLTGTSANYDWGVFNAIENGGNLPGMWRTLTYNEWYFIIYTRPKAAEKMATGRIQMGKGRYVNGCLLLPDEWVLPKGCTFEARTSNAADDYSSNTYTLAQWALMQANGAVFLPAAGYRIGWELYDLGIYGRYWSSTYDNAGSAYILNFQGHQVKVIDFDRSRGRSVRLVHEVE